MSRVSGSSHRAGGAWILSDFQQNDGSSTASDRQGPPSKDTRLPNAVKIPPLDSAIGRGLHGDREKKRDKRGVDAAFNRRNGHEPTTRAELATLVHSAKWPGNSQPLGSDLVDRPTFLLRIPRDNRRFRRARALAGGSFTVQQEWLGRVETVSDDRFGVRLIDRTGDGEEELAELWLDAVSPSDRPLVRPGAIFYWIIGYRDEAGQRRQQSTLIFRRAAQRTEVERTRIAQRAERLRLILGAATAEGLDAAGADEGGQK